MAQRQSVLGPEFARSAVRLVLTVVGLLILRALFNALPMMNKASAIGDSLISPLVIANAVVDTIIFLSLLQFGLTLGRSVRENYRRFSDLGNIIALSFVVVILILAYKQYETPTACLAISPSDLAKAGQPDISQMNLDQILPGLRKLAGDAINAEAKMASGELLVAYQRIAVLVLRQPPDLYGWIFLALVAIPGVGIVVLVSRNMDTITNLVMQSGSALTSVPPPGGEAHCAGCGEPLSPGSKFCANCGAAFSASSPEHTSRRTCPSCGTDNLGSAKFCKDCGHAV